MAKETISGLLSMAGSLRQRLSELKSMKESLTRVTHYYGDNEREDKPTYDIKVVDRMCTNLQNALFRIDKAVKRANAITEVEVEVDYDELMKPIE